MGGTSANISRFLQGTAQAKARAKVAAVKALEVFGEHVIGDAQQLTPVDTGALAASGTTLPVEDDGNKLTKVIGFNTNYAAAVHERMDAKHTQGQAKFLSTAVNQNKGKFETFVAGRVKAALEGGGA